MSVRDDIQKLYIGYLGRPADAAGLDYWEKEISDGVMTMEQLRSNLVNEQPEYADIYGDKTRAQLVTEIYTNLFERAPEAAGFEYWVNGDGSTVEADQLIEAFLNAASTDDQAVVDNKLEVANHYTAELGGADTFDKAEAATFIDAVDGTDASVIDAKGDIDAAVAVSGETFTLTEAFAADELPASYTLTDASIDLDTLTVAAANEQLAELQTIIDGADNADELTLDASYTLEDSLENFMAAEEGVVDDADSYTIADGIGPLSTGTFAEMQIIANATEVNVLDEATVQQIADFNTNYDNLGTYSLADTTASLLDAASSDIVAGAEGITVSGALTVDQYSAFDAEFARDFTYSLADTLDNLAAAPEGVVDGADDYSLADAPDAFTDLSVADALSDVELSIGEGALNSDDYVYTLSDTLENFMGAAEGVVDDADSYTIDAAAVYNAGEQTVADVNADYTEAADLIAGAENSADLTLAGLFTYSLADTFENLVAAEDSLVDDAAAYSLTDPAGTDLGELSGDEYAVADGATNTEDFTFTVEPADVLSITPASSTVVEGEAITLDVALSHAVNVDRVLDYKLEGVETAAAAKADPLTDLGQITGKVTVAAGETTATITLTPAVDVTEGLEAFSVKVLDENFAVAQSTDPITIQDAPNSGQAFTLTTGIDKFTGGAGNDTYTGVIDGTIPANATFTSLDNLDGGDGNDVLNLYNTSALANDKTDLTVATIKDIETINIQAVGDISNADSSNIAGTNEVDFSAIAGLTTINATKSQAALIEAADTTDVNVSGASGLISVVGGKNIVVNDTTADKTIKVGDIGNIGGDAVGTITITDTKNGSATAANNDITVEGGTDVTVTTTADKADSGDITVGNATNGEPSGTVVITQNSTSNGTAMTAGDVTVVGGSTVDITANMTNTAVKGGGTNPITAGAFDVTGGDATTEVTITQNATATDFEDDADPGTAEVTTITFGALKAGESVAISEGAQNITGTNSDDLAFTAAKDLTANQVAAAFANLTNGDTQAAGGIVDNGVFTGALDAGWTSGEASGANVTFTSTGFVNEPNLDITTDSDGDWSAISPATNNADFKIASNTNGTVAGASTAVDVSEDYGDVTISDNATASIKTITVDGYAATSTITGTTVLETLNLSNAAAAVDMTVADTAATLNLTLEKLGEIGDTKEAKLTLTAAPTTLNVTSTGDNYVDLTAAATETLNVSGTGTLDIADDDLAGLKTVKVTETAGLILTPLAHDTIESVDTTGTTGTVTATIDGTKATYAGGAGMDNLTIATAGTAVSKAIDLGKGNDTLTLVGITVAVPTETLKGGEGDDTLSIDAASAAVLDNNTNFATALDSFETLFINTAAGDDDNSADTVTLDMEALGFNSVISSGTVADTAIPANADTLVFDNMSSGATVIFLDAPADANTVQQVNIKGANSNSTDVFNGDFVFTNNYGTLTVAETETINLNSGDIATVELVANKATAVNLTGSDFILDTTGTEITSVDASELTGGLTYAADGATAGTTVKGGEGADVLIADGSQDTLIGNDGDDTLIGTSLTQMTGGDGNDTFIGGVSTNVNSASAVLDAASGDVIKLVDSTVGDMVGFNSAQITLDPSGDPDLQNYADAAIDGITADNNAAWFQYNDNTYIVMEDNNADTPGSFVNGEDVIIKLTGLVDLSEASFNATDGTLELA